MYYPYKVIVYLKQSSLITELQDYGKSEDESNHIATAKRMIESHTGKKTGYIRGLDKLDRISVEDIPSEIKKTWPVGVKTIPVYYFEYEVDSF